MAFLMTKKWNFQEKMSKKFESGNFDYLFQQKMKNKRKSVKFQVFEISFVNILKIFCLETFEVETIWAFEIQNSDGKNVTFREL